MLTVQFTDKAINDYKYWLSSNSKIANKIDKLVDNCQLTPYEGLGKPEPLKHEYAGTWSRRINKEHRLVYILENNILIILQCRFHYKK